ncbi:hypothetical protein GCM10010532_023930 [Dactylosporangium siamense]|uniref:Uncharacterized protein n=1 Tax=Dactylosporangium siamense TaxID=685454 RepID=A0A919PHQ3_9ACTN|nr:hypothetical protein Dsi01nite_016330 [Dactylosporangium siamense]
MAGVPPALGEVVGDDDGGLLDAGAPVTLRLGLALGDWAAADVAAAVLSMGGTTGAGASNDTSAWGRGALSPPAMVRSSSATSATTTSTATNT